MVKALAVAGEIAGLVRWAYVDTTVFQPASFDAGDKTAEPYAKMVFHIPTKQLPF
jgi:hypothetical protein